MRSANSSSSPRGWKHDPQSADIDHLREGLAAQQAHESGANRGQNTSDAFFYPRPPPTLAQEFARPVSQGCEHDSSWGTLHLSTKRRNAGTPMLARAGEGFAIRTARAGAGMTWTKEWNATGTYCWSEGLCARP